MLGGSSIDAFSVVFNIYTTEQQAFACFTCDFKSDYFYHSNLNFTGFWSSSALNDSLLFVELYFLLTLTNGLRFRNQLLCSLKTQHYHISIFMTKFFSMYFIGNF